MNSPRLAWHYSAEWRDQDGPHASFGYVKARDMTEAEKEVKETHPLAKVTVQLSGWNRRR